MFDAADSPRFDTPSQPIHRSTSPSGGRAPIGGRRNWVKTAFSTRPFGFWQWPNLGQYLEFLAGLIVVLGVSQVIFGRWMWYIDA